MKTIKKPVQGITILEELRALKELGVAEFATNNGSISYSVKFREDVVKTYVEVPEFSMPTPSEMKKTPTLEDELFDQGIGNAVV